ncbi:hypothetical protein FB107DRAFT_175799, partial [Schizophyllum commune]
GQTSLVSSRANVESPSLRDTVKFSLRDAGPSTKDLDAHSDAHRHALTQRDRMRANAEGQTAVSSCHDVKLCHVHSAEEHAPQLFPCDAVALPKPVNSSSAGTSVASSPAPTGSNIARGSDLPKESGLMSSATPPLSPAHVSPDLSCAFSRETKARNLHGVDVPAVQEAQVRLRSESRGRVLSSSRNDAQATAPCAPLAAHAINPLRARAIEAAISGGGSAVEKQREEGITSRSSVDACDLMRVALPRQSGEKAASPDAAIHARAVAKTRARISSHSSRADEKRSPQGAQPEYNGNPAKSPDWDGQDCALHVSADSLSPLPSTALRRQATCEPPDKTNSNDSSLRSGRSTSRLRSAPVPSAAPPFRSSHPSTYESGPDSTNWRARGLPSASSLREVNILEAGLRSKGVGKCEHASKVFGLEQDSIRSLHASGDEKGLPQTRRDRDENPEQSPDLDGQHRAARASAESLSIASSTAPRRRMTREPPDKTTSSSSSLRSCEPPSHLCSSTVSSSAALLQSSLQSTSGYGPDSANWRACGQLTASLPWEDIGTESLKARGDKESSPQAANSDRDVANLHHPRLEASTQAPAQGYSHVYTGGQESASSRRDGEPASSLERLPLNAGWKIIATVLDDSVCAHATVKSRAEVNPRSSRNMPECSPRSNKRDYSETRRGTCSLSSYGQCHIPRSSTRTLSPSSSTPLGIIAVRKLSDETSHRSSPNGYQPARHRRPASVPSSTSRFQSSRGLNKGLGPDRADWRAREWPAALMQVGIDAQDAGEQIAVTSRKDIDFSAALNGRGYSSQPDFALRQASELQDDGVGDLKHVHAGGQTTVSSYKDVK